MKATCCLLGLLATTLAFGQDATPTLNLDNPSSFATRQTCLATCEQVFTDCKAQCADTSADAHERHFDTPDLPESRCIQVCTEDLRLCKEDC
jgi:hypothetical protein